MNREIKFRAWDGDKMNYDWLVARPQYADSLKVLHDEDYAKQYYRVKEWKLMEWTGCKDVKGVDIYEGDIVKGGTFFTTRSKRKKKTSFIIYRHNGFWVDAEDFGNDIPVGCKLYFKK